MRTATYIAILITACGSAAICRADSLGARMDVTATVVSNCRLTVPPLSFGSYDPLDANAVKSADASVTVIVNCTRSTTATVSFDVGQHGVGNGDRSMSGPGPDHLEYQIFRDSARSQIWARGSDVVRIVSAGINNPDQLTVFGRILPRQEVEPGAYIDVLTATVDF